MQPQEGSGSPVGNVLPVGVSALYVDLATPGLWQATGAGVGDWTQIGGGQAIVVALSSADILSWALDPMVLLAAPAGTVLFPLAFGFVYRAGETPYDATDGTTISVSQAGSEWLSVPVAGFIDQAASQVFFAPAPPSPFVSTPLADVADEPLTISAAGPGAPVDGDGTLSVSISYVALTA